MKDKISQKTIKTRKIFYLAGYDPRGVRFYYQNLKTALEKFCERDCVTITLSARKKQSPLETHCHLHNQADNVATDYSFLHWDDLIKKTWIRSDYHLFAQGLKSYADIFCHFSWRKLFSMPRAPILTLLYPFLTLILFPLCMTLLASCFYNHYATPLLYFIVFCLLWIQYLPKLQSNWLLRFFIFNHQEFMHYSKDYDQRAQRFAQIITQSFGENYDEILLIAHSNGSIATIPIINHLPMMPKNFKIVTLGHCTPLITINKISQEYINMVQNVQQKTFKWFDIGFPPDGACYAKTNPLDTYRPDNQLIKVQFKSISPQFFNYYTPEIYQKLRKDKFQLHFSYLVTHDKKSPTEFIDILTSPYLIDTRFV
ncbi:MAG: hypothetical protein ACJA1M_001154 [Alphaproteobacteria bacterium]|jgi:hypothetical protein